MKNQLSNQLGSEAAEYLHRSFAAAGSAQDLISGLDGGDLDFAQELCEAALTRLMDIKTRILNAKIAMQWQLH